MNFRYLIYLLVICFSYGNLKAQIYDPVDWETSVKELEEDRYELIITATIESGWHLYSQDVPKDGPIATTFNFQETDGYSLEGATIESEGVKVYDPVFEMEIKYFENTANFRQTILLENPELKEIRAEVEFMVCDEEKCLPPNYVELVFSLKSEPADNQKEIEKEDDQLVSSNQNSSNINQGDQISESKINFWEIFFIAFLSGFAALLTPCVFPMIPLTVSYFTKQNATSSKGIRNAIIYSFSIIIIYVLLGTAVTAIFGADSLNALATNVWFNLIFFVLLVVFAISFLGAFEIRLPNKWANLADKHASKGGMIGIFFMALALAIVSFSCTGPIVGTLLVEAAIMGGTGPIVGMLGFSLAIALPFGLFAIFPGWLSSLPKSGDWLNTVKVVLGFLELALAFKFLSQADLVLQLHIIERELFIAIWIVIFGSLGFYLLGKIRFKYDQIKNNISVGRFLLGLLVLTFTLYLVPGLWGAPLKLISAFPPPIEYSESPYGVGNNKESITVSQESSLPETAHLLPPHDILSFRDYEDGLAYAQQVNKPILLDFTGWACVNCRKMEQNVWSDQRVLDILKNDVVLVSLYVDDKRELPGEKIQESKIRPGETLKYIGQKWSEFQARRFNTNTQPFYVLLNHEEEKLIEPVGYMPDADKYYNWLVSGIEVFKEE